MSIAKALFDQSIISTDECFGQPDVTSQEMRTAINAWRDTYLKREGDKTSERVFFLKSDKFVSEYQGRLYENYGDNGIYDGKKVYLDGMREYFSEGVRVFYTDPRLLEKKDPDLYEYIKELMK